MGKRERRKNEVIERDRAIVAHLYLTQWSQTAIAKRMEEILGRHYTIKMVEKDLEAIRRKWEESQVVDFDRARNHELAKIDALEREAFEAWRKSQTGRHVESAKSAKGGMHGNTSEESTRHETSAGDPRFMTVVQWCINKRCELKGLDAPLAIDITSGGKPFVFTLDIGENIPEEEVREIEGSDAPILPDGDAIGVLPNGRPRLDTGLVIDVESSRAP